jgi:hypothetical protein
MTAHDLAQQLLAGPDLEVKFAYNYGDHWRTTVTEDVEKVRVKEVTYSDYHDMDRVVTDEDFDMDVEVRQVVLLF